MNGEWNDSDVEMEEDDSEQEEQELEESEGDPDELDCYIDIEGDESEYIDECPVDITHFDLIKKLGSGAYGTVFLVRKNCGVDVDKIYALKVISKQDVVRVPKTIVHMKAERKALEIVRDCAYVQKLYYAFQTGDKLFLVTEYLPGGEMFTEVQKGALPELHVRFYIAELIIALEHIHLQGIIYRDIKLENVLLDADGHVKLVDFGLCKKLGSKGRSKSFCGTEEYMAPEVIACTGHNTAADWWALGVLAIELLTTMTPFGANEGGDTIMNRITNECPIMPSNISEEMEDFLRKILEKDPTKRLGGCEALATEIKQHKLFDGIDWGKLERKELKSPSGAPTITHQFDTRHFSEEFTTQPATYNSSDVPPNSFLVFKGYSYIAPELQPIQAEQLIQTNDLDDDSTDENLNSLTRDILSNRDPNSEFHKKYKFVSNQPLGTGKSSVCMKCYSPLDDNYYAVKIYKLTDKQRYDNQIAVLQRAADQCLPGVVHLIEVLTDSKWMYLVMELIDGLNLLDYCRETAKQGITKGKSKIKIKGKFTGEWLSQLFVALWDIVKTVHELKYTHGRICFKNIYCMDQELRLIGFGNAKPITQEQDEQIDSWSMGVCIYTILCGRSPFHSSTINSGVLVDRNRIERNDFFKDSKQWSELHSDVKCYILQLLCNTTPTHSPDALLNEKFISFSAVHCSRERLVENEKIIEARASKMETKFAIKTEVISDTNEIDAITNGAESAENRLPVNIPQESQTNGRVNIPKRPRDEPDRNAPEGNKRKTKRKNPNEPEQTRELLNPREIKQERKLRTRKPINDVHKSNTERSTPPARPTAVHKEEVVEDEIRHDNVIVTKPNNRRGRPKKEPTTVATSIKAPTTSQRPTTQPIKTNKRAAQTHSANQISAICALGEAARTNWVYGWRPRRVIVPFYCFERFDYK